MTTRRLLPLAVAALVAAGLAGCDGSLRMEGMVNDPQGRPLPGALVSVPEYSEFLGTATADSTGRFSYFSLCRPGKHPYRVAVELDGFQPAYADVLSGIDNRLQVVLEPDGSGAPSSAWLVAEDGAARDDE